MLEAILIFSGLSLAIGILLYVPGMYIARRHLRKTGRKNLSKRITRHGLVFYGLLCVTLFTGFSMQYLSPQSLVGRVSSTRRGRYAIAAAIVAVAIPLSWLLEKKGISLITNDKKPNKAL